MFHVGTAFSEHNKSLGCDLSPTLTRPLNRIPSRGRP